MKWNKKQSKTLFMAIILLAFGSMYLIIDYSSMPTKEEKYWNGIFEPVTYKQFSDSRKSLKISLGDGFISNIESIFIHLSLMFGAMRLVDFMLSTKKDKKNINKMKDKYNKVKQ